MLTQQHIDIIKSLVPLLEETGTTLTDYFYQRMFKQHPELKHIFNMSHQESGRQKAALFNAIAAYAKHIETPEVLRNAVERIAQKHTSFNVKPEMYDIVGHHLTETLRELTGEIFTQQVEEAWNTAYQFLAEIFIHRENQLYQERVAQQGGWQDAREFVVKSKVTESELVKSFVFAPLDGGNVLGYQPGQYLGIKLNPDNHPYTEIRQYSLSDKPNGSTYRISVKRETHGVPGVVSNFLHDSINEGDIVELYPPAGDFYFEDKNTPVVLVSAGVGVTPMQAMLEQLAAQQYEHDVWYLHACENSNQHSFAERTKELTQRNKWQQYTWYANEEKDGVFTGLLDFDAVNLPFGQANFYVCGPVGFMRFVKQQLINQGVASERIHYEVFGPHEDF